MRLYRLLLLLFVASLTLSYGLLIVALSLSNAFEPACEAFKVALLLVQPLSELVRFHVSLLFQAHTRAFYHDFSLLFFRLLFFGFLLLVLSLGVFPIRFGLFLLLRAVVLDFILRVLIFIVVAIAFILVDVAIFIFVSVFSLVLVLLRQAQRSHVHGVLGVFPLDPRDVKVI